MSVESGAPRAVAVNMTRDFSAGPMGGAAGLAPDPLSGWIPPWSKSEQGASMDSDEEDDLQV